MRNLKKVLTLVLTVAMLLSVMVVGTGAAFSDQDSIKNTEAVDMCVALNIINGIDGSYRPANNVTRGQMCKMICIALNGGKEPTLGTNNTPTFNDVRTNPSESWAEKFIESCYSQGIVSGVGGGRFNPGGPVTGTQAARMLLVALGYKADLAGFTGDAWAVNVNVAASNRGLYAGLENMDANAALSRDNAAQMIWNALRAYEVEYVSTLTTAPDGSLTTKNTVQDRVVGATNDKITLLQDKFNSNYFEGAMVGYAWNESKKAYEYDISYWDDAANNGKGAFATRTFTYTGDCKDLFGMNVRVVYTYDVGNARTTVFGIIPQDSSVIVTGILDDISYVDSSYIKVGDTRYRTDSDALTGSGDRLFATAENQLANSVVLFKDKDHLSDGLDATYTFRALDTDNNDRIDTIIYMPVYAAKVTSVGTKQITVAYHGDFKVAAEDNKGVGTTTLKIEDNDIYDGVAKDDYVLVTSFKNTAYDKHIVEKMSSFDGTTSSTRDGSTKKVQVDSNWYTDRNNDSLAFRLGGTYTYYNVGSFVLYAEQKGAASLNDVLYVEALATDTLSKRAKVWFYDGTSATVTLGDVYNVDGDTELTSIADNDSRIVNKTFTYSEKNGEYTLTLIGKMRETVKNDLGYTFTVVGNKLTAATDNVAGKLDGMSISDDAVVFVKYQKNGVDKYKVVSGAVAKHYSSDSSVTGEALYDKINGTNTVVLAHITMTSDLPNAKGVSGNYGYVVSAPFYSKIDGTKVIGYEIWDGKNTTTIYDEDNGTTAVVKGDVITFDNLGEGNVDNVKLAQTKDNKLIIDSVAGVEGQTFTVTSDSTKTYIITDKTTVLYVDSDDYAGVESGSVQQAADKIGGSAGEKVKNIAYVVSEKDGDNANALKLDLLVVEVNGDWGTHAPTVPAVTSPAS